MEENKEELPRSRYFALFDQKLGSLFEGGLALRIEIQSRQSLISCVPNTAKKMLGTKKVVNYRYNLCVC